MNHHVRIQAVFTAVLSAALLLCVQARAVAKENPDPAVGSLNKAARIEWFRDQGFGLFIHWGVDGQLGATISHSLVGASDDYTNRFFKDLPKTFDPEQFNPQAWARLAKVAGVRYVMFTTKHHSGFAMYDTSTTSFGVMHTPFHRDITAEVFKAFREQGIAPGVYFSPDDFHWLHTHGKVIEREVPEVQPVNNPGLMAYDKAQLRELLTKYGQIDLLFLDGGFTGLRELAWKLQPNIVVTRGAMQTPEQRLPGVAPEGPWESCVTIGDAWQYQPQNDDYKSGRELIRLLIHTRAKGGNLLLDVGPKPNGELPIQEEDRLREIGLWMFVNGEAIYGTRAWTRTAQWTTGRMPEQGYGEFRVKYDILRSAGQQPINGIAVKQVFFTKKADTLYAITPGWPGETLVLKDIDPASTTTITLLGVGTPLKWKKQGKNVVIETPRLYVDQLPCKYAYAFKLTGIK